MNPKPHESANELLLRDLVSGIALPTLDAQLSVGLVGSARHAPQPPSHCLQACLGGDPGTIAQRGCPFLAAAAGGSVDHGSLREGRCQKGYQVHAQTTVLGDTPAVLVTVEGRPATGGGAPLLQQLETTAQLVQRVGQVLEENAGFANEVLQNYEQLNLIFDLTQQILQVTDAGAIERLLMDRVARLLQAEAVVAVSAGAAPRQFVAPNASASGDGAVALLESAAQHPHADVVRRSRQVHVWSQDGRQVIAGPLLRIDEQVDVVLATRPANGQTFKSGDMMAVESVLAFGGQIISNTELHERMRRMSLEVTRALVAAIDKKDHYTSGHSERGGFLTRLTAHELGVPPAQQQVMEWAGLLHDVGKIGIPEEILCKPGKLSPEEFAVIKEHPRMGCEILQPIASLSVILDGVLYHHEYPDGSGYPEGLHGDDIPLVARIVHVVDTFDALTSSRPYRTAFSLKQAVEIMQAEKGRRSDTEVTDAFFRAFEAYRRNHPTDFAARFPHLAHQESGQ